MFCTINNLNKFSHKKLETTGKFNRNADVFLQEEIIIFYACIYEKNDKEKLFYAYFSCIYEDGKYMCIDE